VKARQSQFRCTGCGNQYWDRAVIEDSGESLTQALPCPKCGQPGVFSGAVREAAPPVRKPETDVRNVNVSGYVSPFMRNNQPAWLHILGDEPTLYCAIFSTIDKLHKAMSDFGIGYDKVIVINDGTAFLDSFRGFAKVILDPHRTPSSNAAYTQLFEIPKGPTS
jgi:hypothetical protein